MAKKDQPVYVQEKIHDVLTGKGERFLFLDRSLGVETGTADERLEKLWALILRVREAEQFCKYGRDWYGDDWPDYIPKNEKGVPIINELTWILFRYRLQLYQAELHYCPIPDRQVMGGSGCGKTEAAAISQASKGILWLGHDTLWTAPSLEQATLGHDLILGWGAQGFFTDIFVERSVRGQKPQIDLRKWDSYDPGGRLVFRSIGSDPVELLRGGTFAFAVADEAMRAFNTDWYIGPLTGRLRGPNRAVLNQKPELALEYADRIHDVETCYDPVEREELRDKLEEWIEEASVAKTTTVTTIGNAPRLGRVWWNRLKHGHNHPDERYSRQWSSRNNLYLSRAQIKLQEAQFADRPEELELELDAKRVYLQGDVFPYLDTFFDSELTQKIVGKIADEEDGWIWKTHELHGVYHYEQPPQPGAVYAFALDPGSGILPKRNKWVLIGCRIDKGPPFEIVYIQAGNLPGGHGTPDPWIHAAQDVLTRYSIAESGFNMEASGTQKDTHYTVWKDNLILIPVNVSNNMARLTVQAQRTVRKDMWWCPDCVMFEDELAEFRQSMKKTEPQDFAVTFLLLNDIIYNQVEGVRSQFEAQMPETEEPEPEEIEHHGRETRMRSREHRGRR